MTDKAKPANEELIRAVWDEARDLIKRLEGSTVERFSVEAGDTKIEIERGMSNAMIGIAPVAPAADEDAGAAEMDGGHAIKAPLVGTFYRAGQPGAAPFVEEAGTRSSRPSSGRSTAPRSPAPIRS